MLVKQIIMSNLNKPNCGRCPLKNISKLQTDLSRNLGTNFEVFKLLTNPIENVSINLPAVEQSVANLCNTRTCSKTTQTASLLRSIACMDLTTLNGDDTESNVERLCHKAVHPISKKILDKLDVSHKDFQVGAVCVYPAQVTTAVKVLKKLGSTIPVAAVAAGFPSGQYHISTRLEEIRQCVANGAKEIDIVISRELALRGKWEELYNEVKLMKEACGNDTLLKTIIAAGELGSFENIYKASVACMAAGSDFIKTSTGKESVNATLMIAVAMTRAIYDYYNHTGFEVGFKPAGGIRTAKDVFYYQSLMTKELSLKWVFPDLFRIGASSLLADVEQNLYLHVLERKLSNHMSPFA